MLSKWGYRQRFREEQKPDAPFSFCGQVSSVTIGQMSMFIPLIAKGGRRESIAVYSDRRGVFSFTPRQLVVQWPDNLALSRQISPFLAGAVTALSFLNFISLFWLHWVFIAVHRLSLVVVSGSYSSCGAWASHCGGFSSCRAWVPGCVHFSSWNTWALSPHDMWNLPRPDRELVDS